MISDQEWLAFLPIAGLAILYICRDVLLFNRLTYKGLCIRFTRTQLRVAVIFYPVWMYLVWVENLSQKRRDFTVVALLNISTTLVGWWTTVAIFNDDFKVSKQQLASLVFTFALNGLWRVMSILIFST